MTSARADCWVPYAPDMKMPWNLRRVVHLHRRAGFAGSWDEIRRDLAEGPVAAVDRFLAGTASTHTPADFGATAEIIGDAATAAGDIVRLKAWWFYRMLLGPDPLGEKLTLLWHDHFATGNAKVQDPALMRRQNETFRKHARGRFADLLSASVREPALLLYLDAQANRKGHPNENLGRELMELFTLGAGHYTERDVKEAARALTGWTVDDGQFAEAPHRHDDGEKTVLGHTGRWTGSDLVKILREHPATAERIAVKLCRLFFGEEGVPAEPVRALAVGLREHELDVGWAVGTVLRSRRFFDDSNIGTRVLGPVEFVVGAARALAMFDPAPSTLALADWAGRMGQDLFDPPNVGGWPGGRAWIHTRGLVARANYAGALAGGPGVGRSEPYDPTALPKHFGVGSGAEDVLTFHCRLLFGTEPGADLRRRTAGIEGSRLVSVLLAEPEAQLG